MNTLRNSTRRVEEDIANAEAFLYGYLVPFLEEGENDNQALVNPLLLTDENIRATLLYMSQEITTQAQAMTAQDNREVVHRANQQVATLWYFNRINHFTFYGSKVKEDPNEFID